MSVDGRRVLAVIPARAGSKGLPGKNVRPLAGKPLIAWSIEAALAVPAIDDVIVTTDGKEIADAAVAAGAEVPFMRPSELATDTATGTAVAVHAVNVMAELGRPADIIVLLQPTSPLRSPKDIEGALDEFVRRRAKAVVSVSPVAHHPYRMNTLPEDHSLADFVRPEARGKNRQDLPEYYEINGAVYVADTAWLAERGSFVGEGAYAYVMPAERSVDIDSIVDFLTAEALIEHSRRDASGR